MKQHDQALQLAAPIEQIELHPNASKFAIFSAIRSSVLESETKHSETYSTQDQVGGTKTAQPATCCFHCAATCKSGALIDCRCHQGQSKPHGGNDSDNESYTEDTTEKDVILQVPQVRLIVTLILLVCLNNVCRSLELDYVDYLNL